MPDDNERPDEKTIDQETAVPLPARDAMSVVDASKLVPFGPLPPEPVEPTTPNGIPIGRTPDGR